MKIHLVLIICLFTNITFAQTIIKGKIIDAETKQGISFASIIYQNDTTLQGGYTDSLGIYTIKQLDLDLQISCIGYQTLKLNGKDLLLNKEIQLKPLVYELGVVEVKPRKNIILQLGYFKNKVYTITNKASYKQVLVNRKVDNYITQRILNELDDTNLLITKLKYNLSNHFKKGANINNEKCEPTLLRVHLFEVDVSGKPGKEMLTKNIIFKNDCQKDNLIVDISEENIYMPSNGVFVGLEFIENSRSAKSSNFPFSVVSLIKEGLNTYYSSHQENWRTISPSIEYKGKTYTAGFNVQFGIEVLQ